MWNIFGDTDDITFGSNVPSPRIPKSDTPQPLPQKNRPVRSFVGDTPRKPSSNHLPSQSRKSAPFTPPEGLSLSASLVGLVSSMKPTFLPPFTLECMRIVMLSSSVTKDPMMLVRNGDSTLLVGTGFGILDNAGKSYPTFPDMRLVQSEKDHLSGWILLESGFDSTSFQMILEMLDFPFVYATRDVIAYIRDTVKDMQFLDRCRFFELFSPGVDERKIWDFLLKHTTVWLSIQSENRGFIDTIHRLDVGNVLAGKWLSSLASTAQWYSFSSENLVFLSWEIIDVSSSKILKNTFKFTFDVLFRDQLSVGVVAGYALKDRDELASNGVLTFVLEEDIHARAIVWHIFIDSRGFVHAYEMMSVHKQILKWIRHIYEETVLANPRIERWELVQILRRELTKYCYLITGRTPVVMPIIIER